MKSHQHPGIQGIHIKNNNRDSDVRLYRIISVMSIFTSCISDIFQDFISGNFDKIGSDKRIALMNTVSI